MATEQEVLCECGMTMKEVMKYCSKDCIESLPINELNMLIHEHLQEEYNQARAAYKKAHPYYEYELCWFDEEDMIIPVNNYNLENLKKYNVINVLAYNKTLDNLYITVLI